MLAGSAQTRKERRLTRSLRCPSAARTGAATPATRRAAPARTPISEATLLCMLLLGAKAGLLVLFGRSGLLGALGRTPARQTAHGPGLEVDVDVVDVAHHVGVIA